MNPTNNYILHTPEYQNTDAHHQIRHERSNRRHLDELFEIEHGRQQAWKISFDKINVLILLRVHAFNSLPVPIPQNTVAKTGVFVFSLTVDKHLNKRPSLDMAYKILGIGNKHPNKLRVR